MTPGVRVAVLMLVVLVSIAAAQRVAQQRPSDYVNDFAHVLNADTTAQLDNICQQIDRKARPNSCSYCQLGRRLWYRKLWRRSIQTELTNARVQKQVEGWLLIPRMARPVTLPS